MRILLFAPPTKISERYGVKTRFNRGYLPPLGLLQIAAVLEKVGHKIKIVDLSVLNMSNEEIRDWIKSFNPGAVGFTALNLNFNKTSEIAKIVKETLDIPIIFGGPHVTVFSRKSLEENPWIDIAVIGEGEKTIIELIKELEDKKSLNKIKGICFRDKKGKIIITSQREYIKNLDELPFPAYHLVDLKSYTPLPNQYKRLPAINVVTSRGCPWGKCTYCFESARLGYFRRISPKKTIELIKNLIEKYGIKEISFWDDMFIVGEKWIIEFCQLMIQEKIDLTWSCYSRVDMVNLKILKKMKEAGCWNIFYGIESGSQELLDNIKKGITLKQCKNAIKWTKEAGIESRGALMFALPGETPKKAEKTIQFAIDLDLDYVQFAYTVPFKGTELYTQCINGGRLETNTSKYSSFEPVYLPEGYNNKKELKKVLKKAYAKFYFRPKYILKKIKSINSLEDVSRLIFGFIMLLGFTKTK